MPYRILSPTAILGYGFPEASFNKAMGLDIDLIAVDAGSMDAGPYHLGSGAQYVGRAALQRDLTLIVQGALQQQCPLVVGSAGFSGASPALDEVLEIIQAILQQADADETKLAVIDSDIPASLIEPILPQLEALGRMPALTAEELSKSRMVGQMGIEPIIAALDAGAQFVVCGRAYDPAVFAADPVRKGYPIGPALHAAKILECGAIACEPGSGSDCLIAELYLDGRAEFFAPNQDRRASLNSIAAHTLYEKSRPDIFHLPGGVLDIRQTRFYEVDEHKAGFSGSIFHPMPYSIKIEGSMPSGYRCLSIAFAKSSDIDEEGVLVYGKNGVEANPPSGALQEVGILCEVKGRDKQQTKDTLAFVRSSLLHYGYPGRLSTAGNLAFPFSPSDFVLPDGEEGFCAVFVVGSRDPFFQQNLQQCLQMVRKTLKNQHPQLAQNTRVEFYLADKDKPLMIIESLAAQPEEASRANRRCLQDITATLDSDKPLYSVIEAGITYQWSVHHLLKDADIIRGLFPIKIFQLLGNSWRLVEQIRSRYEQQFQVEEAAGELFFERDADLPGPAAVQAEQSTALSELVSVVRSKNAGINELTFDILFKTENAYQLALASGLFSRQSLASLFEIPASDVLGSYTYEPVKAIKFTLARPLVSGTQGERDVFGAQQHSRLLSLQIPLNSADEARQMQPSSGMYCSDCLIACVDRS